MSKKSKTEVETPKSSKPSRTQRNSPSTSKSDPRKNYRNDSLWHRHNEDISQTVETPEEEQARIKLHKLESRRRERSGHDDGQDKIATEERKRKEKPPPLITSFKAINESNDENKTEESTGAISPLWKDTNLELYDDHTKPTKPIPRVRTQYADVAQDEGVEISEESEKDVEVEPVGNQVVETSAVHSEFDYDQEEVDYDPEEPERNKETEETKAQIKEEPQSEDGYKQDRETNNESEEEAPASPPRRVIFRDTATGKRNKRRARREKIKRDQATKPAKQRLGDGMAGRTHRRSRTPSTEIMSDENEVNPANQQRVSPETKAKIERNNRNFLRDLKKSCGRGRKCERTIGLRRWRRQPGQQGIQ